MSAKVIRKKDYFIVHTNVLAGEQLCFDVSKDQMIRLAAALNAQIIEDYATSFVDKSAEWSKGQVRKVAAKVRSRK